MLPILEELDVAHSRLCTATNRKPEKYETVYSRAAKEIRRLLAELAAKEGGGS